MVGLQQVQRLDGQATEDSTVTGGVCSSLGEVGDGNRQVTLILKTGEFTVTAATDSKS